MIDVLGRRNADGTTQEKIAIVFRFEPGMTVSLVARHGVA